MGIVCDHCICAKEIYREEQGWKYDLRGEGGRISTPGEEDIMKNIELYK